MFYLQDFVIYCTGIQNHFRLKLTNLLLSVRLYKGFWNRTEEGNTPSHSPVLPLAKYLPAPLPLWFEFPYPCTPLLNIWFQSKMEGTHLWTVLWLHTKYDKCKSGHTNRLITIRIARSRPKMLQNNHFYPEEHPYFRIVIKTPLRTFYFQLLQIFNLK